MVTLDASSVSAVLHNLDAFAANSEAAFADGCADWAQDVESAMQRDARWQDRTGQARASLQAEAGLVAHGVRVVARGGMPYSVYLEFAHGGKYAIIRPTLERWMGRLPQYVARAFGRVGAGRTLTARVRRTPIGPFQARNSRGRFTSLRVSSALANQRRVRGGR